MTNKAKRQNLKIEEKVWWMIWEQQTRTYFHYSLLTAAYTRRNKNIFVYITILNELIDES